MDQDAFRTLLASSRKLQANTATSKSIPQNPTTSTTSGPAFKPRKVKKVESKYRDRAAERRGGTGNDFADVEAVLEDFQKRVAHEDKDVIEQQRKYLGGDSQHTILVKGLDISLLEQNRARAVEAAEDDDILEQVFAEATSTTQPTEPKKRTREDIIHDLKAKRQNGDSNQLAVGKSVEDNKSALETSTSAGKFRPIGFKPIRQAEEKPKKRKVKEGKDVVRKKKQKVESVPMQTEKVTMSQELDTTEASTSKMAKKPPEPEREPTPLDENLDIFAGAGDYEGFRDDESEEEYGDTEGRRATSTTQGDIPPPVLNRRGWFEEPEPEPEPDATPTTTPPKVTLPIPSKVEAEEPVRLKPLESSALPSIRDFLAMSEAAEKAEKRRARKEKKKKKKDGGDDED